MFNFFSRKKILFMVLTLAICAILIPGLSFAAEVMDSQGETLPEMAGNAISKIFAEPANETPANSMENYLCFTPAKQGGEANIVLKKYGNPT